MGCISHRKKQTEEIADQKWDYINLQDFKAKGCGTPFAYAYLWFMLLLSIAVYAVDSFTAINLLVFDEWSSEIEPAIDRNITRWVFSICIILSFLNLGYEGVRAIRVMKRGNVAECYLDNLAVRWESIRVGSGQGWRRFLVFAELTKSKKGAEYIALFTYFSFQGWIRVLICSGPRQVINAFTLKSVYVARFAIQNASVEGSISEFFEKIAIIAEEDYRQALILSGMCFTLVVWAFSVLFMIAAVLFYVFFLFHWIPRADGGLTGYCERKVTKALLKVVTEKVNKALAKGQTDRIKAELKAAQTSGEKPTLARAAALPTLPNVGPVGKEDSLPAMPSLARNDTMSTLPIYTSRPGTPGDYELGSMDQKRPALSQHPSAASNSTYSSNAPLVSSAADMGYARTASPAPMLPESDFTPYPLPRTNTGGSQRSFGPRLPINPQRNDPGSLVQASMPPSSDYRGPAYPGSMPPVSALTRSATARTMDSYNRPPPGPRLYDTYNPEGRSSPAPSMQSYRTAPPLPRQPSAMGQRPFQPSRSATGPVPPREPFNPPQRNLTGPIGESFDRPFTPQSTRRYDDQNFNGSWSAGSQRGPPYGYDEEAQQGRGYY
ncbi:hypothetical protein S40285_04121 [Stachybotrys chlorohalonatus IBT 40285]|uniref:Vacuolar membrane protein n=1 Tax=Stachybotrys chlorohalonatus (strain IBT 40285) TaxID=1283841 RepID=A0A084QI11_STAC4|nr:hypothetical protein S40285_04121 [Stachybotrys chlorohalonata IBT 40285]